MLRGNRHAEISVRSVSSVRTRSMAIKQPARYDSSFPMVGSGLAENAQ